MKIAGIIVVFTVCVWGCGQICQAREIPYADDATSVDRPFQVSSGQPAQGAPLRAKAYGVDTPDVSRITVRSSRVKHRPKFEHILKNTPKDHGLAPLKTHEANAPGK